MWQTPPSRRAEMKKTSCWQLTFFSSVPGQSAVSEIEFVDTQLCKLRDFSIARVRLGFSVWHGRHFRGGYAVKLHTYSHTTTAVDTIAQLVIRYTMTLTLEPVSPRTIAELTVFEPFITREKLPKYVALDVFAALAEKLELEI